MINLIIGNNTVFVTLRERAELTNADILVSFIYRDKTSETKTLKTSNNALPTDRIDNIEIELVTEVNEDLDNAKIYLRPGDYEYRIFESNDGTTDTTGKKELERGIANISEALNTTEYEREVEEVIYKT